MVFAVKGVTFRYDGTTTRLERLREDGTVRGYVDIAACLYSRPSCADAVKVAVHWLDSPVAVPSTDHPNRITL